MSNIPYMAVVELSHAQAAVACSARSTSSCLTGELPKEWREAGAFLDLRLVDVSYNNLSGMPI